MRTFTVDYHGAEPDRIAEGDLFFTQRIVYRAVTIRPMDSKAWPDRWHIDADRLMTRAAYDAAVADGEPPVLFPKLWDLSRPYKRGEGPADNPCGDPACEGCAHG